MSIYLKAVVYCSAKMFNNELNAWYQWEAFQEYLERNAVRRTRRVVPDRMNPFTAMHDSEFVVRFRLNKESINGIIQEIQDQLPDSTDGRGKN